MNRGQARLQLHLSCRKCRQTRRADVIRVAHAGDALRVSAPVLTLTSDPSSSQPYAALVQLQDGLVLRYHAGAGLRALPSWACFQKPCQQVAATPDSALRAAGAHQGPLPAEHSILTLSHMTPTLVTAVAIC